MMSNTRNELQINVNECEWGTLFAILCWRLWKYRCNFLFSNSTWSAETIVSLSRACVITIFRSWLSGEKARSLQGSHDIWLPPAKGWVTVNSDGVGLFVTATIEFQISIFTLLSNLRLVHRGCYVMIVSMVLICCNFVSLSFGL